MYGQLALRVRSVRKGATKLARVEDSTRVRKYLRVGCASAYGLDLKLHAFHGEESE